MSPAEVGDRLGAMPDAEGSQVAIVDHGGNVAVYSGDGLEREAGDARGLRVCATANLMEHRGVPAAAVDAYLTSAETTLSGRLLDALIAADRMGGDVRGRQSAVVCVVSGDAHPPARGDECNLRVDDSRRPVEELKRLHQLWQAHELLRTSRSADGLYRDVALAQAALAIAPEDQTVLGGLGLALLRAGRVSEAIPVLRRLVDLEPRTPIRIQHLIEAGLLDHDIGQQAFRDLSPGSAADAINAKPLLLT